MVETGLYDAVRAAIENLDDDTLIELHNEYCRETNCPDDEIFDMGDFDAMTEGYSPMDIALRIHHGDFNPHHTWWCFDGYANFQSFYSWDAKGTQIFPSDIADYIARTEDALGVDELQDVIDEWNDAQIEDEEEDEEDE